MNSQVVRILEQHVPARAQALFTEEHCSLVTLERGELYKDRSGALSRLQIDVDAWPAPRAGLFVVEERTVYLRSLDPMRKAFADARSFVTPYAATGADEFFAECFRAWCGANSEGSAWPRVSRERLRALHPSMFEFFAQRFGDGP
jgi:hypothetical protein